MIVTLLGAKETVQLGAELWRILPKTCLVFLQGDLGTGKTTLTRGLLRATGYKAIVKSPTYTLVEEYNTAGIKIFHFDLYRIKNPEELELIGIRDYLAQAGLFFIEWPEMGKGFLPDPDIELALSFFAKGRKAKITVRSDKLKNKLKLRWKNQDTLL